MKSPRYSRPNISRHSTRPVARSVCVLLLVLLAGLVGCSPPGAEEIDKAEVQELLEEYLPKLGEAYAQTNPKLIEPWVVPKEVARIQVRIDELESKGQFYEPIFKSLEVVSISPWNYSNAFVTTIEVWDVTSYTLGTRRVISQEMDQKSRVKYQLKRQDDGWVVLYRELEQNLGS